LKYEKQCDFFSDPFIEKQHSKLKCD